MISADSNIGIFCPSAEKRYSVFLTPLLNPISPWVTLDTVHLEMVTEQLFSFFFYLLQKSSGKRNRREWNRCLVSRRGIYSPGYEVGVSRVVGNPQWGNSILVLALRTWPGFEPAGLDYRMATLAALHSNNSGRCKIYQPRAENLWWVDRKNTWPDQGPGPKIVRHRPETYNYFIQISLVLLINKFISDVAMRFRIRSPLLFSGFISNSKPPSLIHWDSVFFGFIIRIIKGY